MTDFPLPRNAFKAALLARERTLLGLWTSLGSHAATEILADAGFDYICVDGEHSPMDVDDMRAQIQAAGWGASSIVARPPVNEAWVIKRLLDIGAQTLIIPMVDTPQQAEAAVAACLYPPQGVRGAAGVVRAARYGRVPGYLTAANAEICVIPQIESVEAAANIEAIAAVPGVDALFVGPADLSASMGFLGQFSAPEVEAMMRDCLARIRAGGKPACTLAFDAETAKQYVSWGADMVAVGSDVTLLTKGARDLLSAFR